MDWFVLLAPIVLLPIVLTFVVVGCGLQEHGEAPPIQTTTLVLNYDLKKSTDFPIESIKASFTVWSNDTPETTVAPTPPLLSYDAQDRAQGTLSKSVNLFSEGEAVSCRCDVLLFRKIPFGSNQPQPTPIPALQASTAEPTKSGAFGFTLKYEPWPDEKDYNLANFSFSLDA